VELVVRMTKAWFVSKKKEEGPNMKSMKSTPLELGVFLNWNGG
jgi:hypothetical protein